MVSPPLIWGRWFYGFCFKYEERDSGSMDHGTIGPIIFGIVIALVVMWVSLKRYEGFFDEKTVFKSLIIGFFTGFLAFLIELITYNVGITFLVFFPFVEQFLKFLGINLPSIRERREIIIYGLVVGLGFGSIYMPMFVLLSLGIRNVNPLSLVGSLLIGTGYIFFHGGTGCMMGYGISRSEKWRYLFYATLLGIPLPIFELTLTYIDQVFVVVAMRILESIYALAVFLVIYKRILPYALPRRKRKGLNRSQH